MSTQRQKKLAKEIIKNLQNKKPKNAGQLLESAGYDETTAKASPGRTIEQKGVVEELKVLGFTEFNAKSVVSSIMNDETRDPNARLKAADMTFKVHGSYAPEKKELSGEIKTNTLTPEQIDKINEVALNDEGWTNCLRSDRVFSQIL